MSTTTLLNVNPLSSSPLTISPIKDEIDQRIDDLTDIVERFIEDRDPISQDLSHWSIEVLQMATDLRVSIDAEVIQIAQNKIDELHAHVLNPRRCHVDRSYNVVFVDDKPHPFASDIVQWISRFTSSDKQSLQCTLGQVLYQNNLKNRFFAASACPQNYSCSLAPCPKAMVYDAAPLSLENFEEPPSQIPYLASCFGIKQRERKMSLALVKILQCKEQMAGTLIAIEEQRRLIEKTSEQKITQAKIQAEQCEIRLQEKLENLHLQQQKQVQSLKERMTQMENTYRDDVVVLEGRIATMCKNNQDKANELEQQLSKMHLNQKNAIAALQSQLDQLNEGQARTTAALESQLLGATQSHARDVAELQQTVMQQGRSIERVGLDLQSSNQRIHEQQTEITAAKIENMKHKAALQHWQSVDAHRLGQIADLQGQIDRTRQRNRCVIC